MPRRRNAPFGLLLENMQNVNGLWEPHGIDRSERISPEVGNNLQHTWCNTFQWLISGFAFSGILPPWTRSNANPISSLTSSGSSRSTSNESPTKGSGWPHRSGCHAQLYNMLVLAYCQRGQVGRPRKASVPVHAVTWGECMDPGLSRVLWPLSRQGRGHFTTQRFS